MSDEETVVAVFRYRSAAEEAVRVILRAGEGGAELSMVANTRLAGAGEEGAHRTGEGRACVEESAALEDSLWGPSSGRVVLSVPGIGRVEASGPLAMALEAGTESDCAFGGLTVLGVVLYALGIPRDSARRYEVALMAGCYLLLVHGGTMEVKSVREKLGSIDAEEVSHYGMAAAGTR